MSDGAILATTEDLAGMLNAIRKVVYFAVDSLPEEKESMVREGVANIIRVLETKPQTRECKSEIATLHTYLTRSDTW